MPGMTPAARFALGAVAIVAMTLIAYIPATGGVFIWDDDFYVTENPTLRDLAGLGRIWFEPTSIPQYYPMVHTTFWIEYHLWGLHPRGYHVVNVLLHALGAVLLWRVLRRLELPGAWVAGAIFALHPVHVESVAWITERKNVLSGVFFLASLLLLLRSFASRIRWAYLFGSALFVCALLSKSVTCSLPAVVLLLLWWKRGRIDGPVVVALAPLFVVGAASGLATAYLEKVHVGAEGTSWDLSLAERVLIAGRALWFYAGKLVWPDPLVFIYPRWEIDATRVAQWMYPLAAAAVPVVLWLARARLGRGPLVAVLIFGGSLLPALGFIDFYPMRYSFVADHFQYLASAALIALFAALGAAALARLGSAAKLVAVALPSGLLLVYAALTLSQGAVYRTPVSLWTDVLAKNPGAWMAHNNLGRLYLDRGATLEAMEHFERSLEIEPENAQAHVNVSQVYWSSGDRERSLFHLRETLRIEPAMPQAHNNLAVYYETTGENDLAEQHYLRAIEAAPGYLRAHERLGRLYAKQRRFDDAIRHFREALGIEPDFLRARLSLARALAATGRTEEAVTEYDALLALRPDHAVARRERARLRP